MMRSLIDRLVHWWWFPLVLLALIGLVLYLLSMWSVTMVVVLAVLGFAWCVYAVERSWSR